MEPKVDWSLGRGGGAALLLLGGLLFTACTNVSPTPPSPKLQISIPAERPTFSSDSAYELIARQLAFGPRIPGTASHKRAGDWLVSTLRRWGARLYEHTGVYKGTPIRNIIASFGPEGGKRVILSAHWDSRPYADRDPSDQRAPVPGANDGASGVAILLEIARLLAQKPLPYPIDIILWDAEDLGQEGVEDSYCLGSQLWLSEPKPYPIQTYAWGIHLDMVGGRDATFLQEGHSRQYAPLLLEAIWTVAQRLGHQRYFVSLPGDPIIDDPFYLSARGGIPMVNIIQRDPMGKGFFPEWHTTRDDLSVIDKATLQAVGETLVAFLYAASPETFVPK
ncbi:MAG: M28 family peptidase [Bacteroidia bacterium]|nr:M28 family peptidase [Bacteroidia bacterium]